MGWFDNIFKRKTPVEVTNKDLEKKEYKKVGSIKLRRGMKLFKFDRRTAEVREVEMKRELHYNWKANASAANISTRMRVAHDPNCNYMQALNYKNAVRKFEKVLNRPVKPMPA